MERLGLRPLELVRRCRHVGRVKGAAWVYSAAAERIPTAIELLLDEPESLVPARVQAPVLGRLPQSMLFIHQSFDAGLKLRHLC